MIIRKCTTNGSKYVEIRDPFLHAIICIYILYEFCIQIVYITFMMYTFGRSELKYTKCTQNVCIQNVSHISTNFVYILYTKCIQKVCVLNVSHILTNFCIENVYKMFLYKMYPTFRQIFVCISRLTTGAAKAGK